MIFNMIGGGNGGGGASLNFKVVGGTVEPASPSENMIWVNTDAEITNWVFSPEVPESPSDGIVWFYVNASKTTIAFEALKENSIPIYPKSAKQYINGAWTNITAKIYQNNKWIEWARYIFRSGEGPIVPITQYGWYRGTATHTNDSIVHSRYDSGNDMSATSTTDIVDLKGYSTIYALANFTSGYSITSSTPTKCPCIGLSTKKPNFSDVTNSFTRPDIALTTFELNSTKTLYSLPIPSGLSAAYIWLHGNGKFEVYDIWME